MVSLSALSDQLRTPVKPIEWAIHDLLDAQGSDVMTSESVLSVENQNRIQWLFDNDANHLPDEHRPACHRDKAHTYSSVYGRMSWDKPAGTITTGFSTPGRGRYIHPLRQRTLLPIEAARIQGFPDGYFTSPDTQKQINRSEIVKWVGDAVPAPLGYPAMICALHGLFNTGKFKLRQV